MKRILPLILFAALPVQTQPSAYTVDEAVRQAVSVHPELKGAMASRQAASADAEAARTQLFPTLTLNSNYTHDGDPATMSFMGMNTRVGAEDDFNIGGTVSQSVYTGGRLTSQIGQARIRAEIARLDLIALENSVTARTREACYEVMRAAGLHKAAVDALEAARQHRRDAEARVRAGVSAGIEVIRADVRVQQAALDEASRRNARELAASRLATLLSLSATTPLEVRGDLPAGDLQKALDDPEVAALRNRPDLVAQRAAARAEELGVAIARAGFLPSVSASWTWNYNNDDLNKGDQSWRIGLTGTWEVFNWNRTSHQVRAADARRTTARERVRNLENEIRHEVRQSALAVATARESILLAEARLRAATEDLRISRLRFNEGVGTGTEVIDAESDHAAAEAQLINARADLAVAANRYWLATGGSF